MSEYFTFDGKKSSDFGVMISGNGVWNAPARRGTQISVPGRNGDVWVDDGAYENIVVTYPCYIADGFADKVDEFRAWLAAHSYGYYRLFDTYRQGVFRNARFLGPFTTEPGTRNLTGRFDVSFECEPYMIGEYGYAELVIGNGTRDSMTIMNRNMQPYSFTISMTPIYEGDSFYFTFSNGDYSETIYMNNITQTTLYDSSTNTFRQGGNDVDNPDLYTTGGAFKLPPGQTKITYGRRTQPSGIIYQGEIRYRLRQL